MGNSPLELELLKKCAVTIELYTSVHVYKQHFGPEY